MAITRRRYLAAAAAAPLAARRASAGPPAPPDPAAFTADLYAQVRTTPGDVFVTPSVSLKKPRQAHGPKRAFAGGDFSGVTTAGPLDVST